MTDFMSAFWIILTGALVAGACALAGCFLVLRRLAMLGDAISHAILPGIVIAFLLTNSMNVLSMFVGAAAVGLLTTFFVQWLNSSGVQNDAALGVTFTSLFALGVVGVSLFGHAVHLDLDCVLYGEIAYTPFDPLLWNGRYLGPRPVWINGGLFLLNLTVITLFYKEFKLAAFDPDMAKAVGLPVTFLHYLLMILVALTTVGAFESVGVILVTAMLITPPATAYLLTEKLNRMLIFSVALGALASLLGYLISVQLDCSIAGAMASVCGLLFAAAFLFSPTHGLVIRWIRMRRLRHRVADEDALLWAHRQWETEAAHSFTAGQLGESLQWLASEAHASTRRLNLSGLLNLEKGRFSLSESGHTKALGLIRAHRLYETYLDELGYPPDHQHDPADRVEHHLSPGLVGELEKATEHPDKDPQGKIIPTAE